MNQIWNLFDYTDVHGRNEILAWVEEARITHGDRAKLDQKLDMLVRMEFDLAYHTKLLARVRKNILKLRVYGGVQMRPMLCQGPLNINSEYTLLAGAREVGGKLRPGDVVEVARVRRAEIERYQGKKHRCQHERFEHA